MIFLIVHLRIGHAHLTVFWPIHPQPLIKTKTDQTGRFVFWWVRVDSDHLRHSQQIYSLPRLSNSGAHPELILTCHTKCGAGSGTRTRTSSLEGLRTSPCTMPAINQEQTDYILIYTKIKSKVPRIRYFILYKNNHLGKQTLYKDLS